MFIIGAGMAGLLAANMLRRHHPIVLEQQDRLPHNHSALLRFRSTAVSDATGIPFKKVLVRKGIWDGEKIVNACTISLANLYSQRAMPGVVESRSIWNLEPEVRWIAPPDFIEQMAKGVNVNFAHNVRLEELSGDKQDVIISTVPMPTVTRMPGKLAGRNSRSIIFHHFAVYTTKMPILSPECHIYQTVYNASDAGLWYRASIHGNELTVESSSDHLEKVDLCRLLLGVFRINIEGTSEVTTHRNAFGKIKSIPEDLRRDFIVHLTETQNIYSLGRFATWRPGLLLDDLVKDITIIERLITAGSYARKLQNTKP